MTQRKKATTKKELKQSIKRLYKALTKEKDKHASATEKVAELIHTNQHMCGINRMMHRDLVETREELHTAQHEGNVKVKHAAELLKTVVQLD